MSTAPTTQARSELVAEWFDSDLPSERLRALQLWRGANGRTWLVSCKRATSSDVWSPPATVDRGISLAAAREVAAELGLDPYLPPILAGSLEPELARRGGVRWTVIREDGLPLYAEDLFGEQEARDYVAANPHSGDGSPVFAVPEHVAREAARQYRAIRERHEEAMEVERRLTVAGLLREHGLGGGERS